MKNELEPRPYGPESTAEECQALMNRVYLLEDRIVTYKEVPIQTSFQVELFWRKIETLTRDLDHFSMLIDLTEAKPPSAEIRELLTKKFARAKRLRHVAVFTDQNFMLNIAAKFVLSGYGIKSYSIHRTMQGALKEIHAQDQG